jgi:hypothetical protein
LIGHPARSAGRGRGMTSIATSSARPTMTELLNRAMTLELESDLALSPEHPPDTPSCCRRRDWQTRAACLVHESRPALMLDWQSHSGSLPPCLLAFWPDGERTCSRLHRVNGTLIHALASGRLAVLPVVATLSAASYAPCGVWRLARRRWTW